MIPTIRCTCIAAAAGSRTRWSFLTVAFVVIPLAVARAAPQDYRLIVANPLVGLAHEASITVRLVHEPDGTAVTNAVVVPRALKMPMQAMHSMGSRVRPATPAGKGDYTFTADIVMEGDWLIEIEARVPGESEPVLATVAVHAAGLSGPGRRPDSREPDRRPEEQR